MVPRETTLTPVYELKSGVGYLGRYLRQVGLPLVLFRKAVSSRESE